MTDLLPVYPRLEIDLVAARGSQLFTADGRRILDLYGGHAVTPLGHGHPALARTLADAYSELDFYSNSLHMRVQQRAAAALLGGSRHLAFAHFVNSGTEANEAALHLARRLTKRSRILSFDCSFHGRTAASLAATGLALYRQRLSFPVSTGENDFIRFGDPRHLDCIDQTVAAVLCESVPSLAGVLMPPEGYYPALQRRCREVGALLIFDEVQGGIGRLGAWFAHQRFGIEPDLVTLAKGIAGGFPAGALLTSQAIGDQVEPGELGTTFGGGPLACAMIETVARVIREQQLIARTTQIFDRLAGGLANLPAVTLRGAGCLIGIQTPLLASELRDRLLSDQILVGTSAEPHTVRLLPAYILTDEEVDRFVTAIRRHFE